MRCGKQRSPPDRRVYLDGVWLVAFECCDSLTVDPFFDFVGVESYELPDFAKWDSSFSDETANESFCDAELFGKARNIQEVNRLFPLVWFRTSLALRCHGVLSFRVCRRSTGAKRVASAPVWSWVGRWLVSIGSSFCVPGVGASKRRHRRLWGDRGVFGLR